MEIHNSSECYLCGFETEIVSREKSLVQVQCLSCSEISTIDLDPSFKPSEDSLNDPFPSENQIFLPLFLR